MQEKYYVQLSFPVSQDTHKKMKTLAYAHGLTLKKLFFKLVEEYFNREENQKLLTNIQ